MFKKDLLLVQNLLKLNFFGCFFLKFFQAKKLKSMGHPLQASCILFHFIHPLGPKKSNSGLTRNPSISHFSTTLFESYFF